MMLGFAVFRSPKVLLWLAAVFCLSLVLYHNRHPRAGLTPVHKNNQINIDPVIPEAKISKDNQPSSKESLNVQYTKPRPDYEKVRPPAQETIQSDRQEVHSSRPKDVKYIYVGSYEFWWGITTFSFDDCEYSNCKVTPYRETDGAKNASVVVYQFNKIQNKYPKVTWKQRSKQLWVVLSWEPPSYRWAKWPSHLNYHMNMTMTYRRDSDIFTPFGRVYPKPAAVKGEINFSAKKKKGAFAYVSNCNSIGYDRISVMKKLRKYIDVDIFGRCSGVFPCVKFNYTCESLVHDQYRFYLSFENSLCQDYITEKLWERLQSNGYYVPVTMGGMSMQEYVHLNPPPNSYIHADNFTTIDKLGEYLKYLSENEEAYSKYHEWRYTYSIDTHKDYCPLCELANKLPRKQAYANIANIWNNASLCKGFDYQKAITT